MKRENEKSKNLICHLNYKFELDAQKWFRYLENVCNLSSNTRETYKKGLFSFCQYLDCLGINLYDATRFDVSNWITSCLELGKQPQTINVYLTAIRNFYKYAVDFHGYTEDISKPFKYLRTEQPLVKYIDKDFFVEWIDSLKPSCFSEYRAIMIAKFFFYTGARCTELCNCTYDDFLIEQGVVRLCGKGDKTRIVPLSDSFKQALIRYKKATSANHDSYIFLSLNNSKLEPFHVRMILFQLMKKTFHKDFCHPHVLRHSFATALINKDVQIEDIRVLLGHSTISTTQIYSHLAYSSLKKDIDRVF